jgi:putative membrane protein
MLFGGVPRSRSLPRFTPPTAYGSALCWAGGAVVSLLLGAGALAAAPPGALAHHMATHLLLMNAVAPLVALAVRSDAHSPLPRLASGRALVGASMLQLVLLWGWHAPPALAIALRIPAVHAAMQMSCFAAALWFWLAILADRSAMRWRALFALLITGKLFCLLGALLVFAPRLLYGDVAAHGLPVAGHDAALADQHLAGLLMLAVCPLTYVLAGVVIAAQWLSDLARTPEPARARDVTVAH